jgi:chromosome partitioning protein
MSLKRILVVNTKGGCGKTTITTNIASHYAQRGLNVRLFDHDNQGSSLAWINRRSASLNQIHGVDASKKQGHRLTRSWKLRVPPETDVAIIDTPAGVDMTELSALFQTNDSIITYRYSCNRSFYKEFTHHWKSSKKDDSHCGCC